MKKLSSSSYFTIFLAIVTVILFAPSILWLAKRTAAHEQLHHALLIFVFSVAALIIVERKKLTVQFSVTNRFYGFLLGAFVIMACASFGGWTFLVGVAFSLAFSAWLGFFYGSDMYRVGNALALAFLLFIGLTEAFQWFDWPLRSMAGQHSAWVLNHLGFESQLHLKAGDVAKLILEVNRRPFEVASECNGYGLISSAAMVALLVVAYRRMTLFDRILCVVAALFLGSLFNTLRILVIVLLAPQVGDSYFLMHEIVGSVFFWGCLLIVWFMVRTFPEKRAAA